MAVYTEVDEFQLKELLKKYKIGSLKNFKAICEGVENTNYYFETEKNPYILTLYEKRVRSEDLPFFIGLMQHLSEELNLPKPIPQKNNNYLSEISGKNCLITSFLFGKSLAVCTANHCQQVGQSLAKLHRKALSYKKRRSNNLAMSNWLSLWNKVQDCEIEKLFLKNKNVRKIIQNELEFLKKLWPQNLKKGIIHADLFMDNVFFIGDQLSAIIDFYFACEDMLSYDLAITMNAWCFDGDFNFDSQKGKALFQAYHKEYPLDPLEVKLFPILLRGAAMRFLLTRIHDWFYTEENQFVKKKSPLEYWKKLNFFQSLGSVESLNIL